MLHLIIIDDTGARIRIPVLREEITVGRAPGNTIRLDERNVSRYHARIVREAERIVVEDRDSYNGVRVNSKRIQRKVEVALGDKVVIGDYTLTFFDLPAEEQAPVSADPARIPELPPGAGADEDYEIAFPPQPDFITPMLDAGATVPGRAGPTTGHRLPIAAAEGGAPSSSGIVGGGRSDSLPLDAFAPPPPPSRRPGTRPPTTPPKGTSGRFPTIPGHAPPAPVAAATGQAVLGNASAIVPLGGVSLVPGGGGAGESGGLNGPEAVAAILSGVGDAKATPLIGVVSLPAGSHEPGRGGLARIPVELPSGARSHLLDPAAATVIDPASPVAMSPGAQVPSTVAASTAVGGAMDDEVAIDPLIDFADTQRVSSPLAALGEAASGTRGGPTAPLVRLAPMDKGGAPVPDWELGGADTQRVSMDGVKSGVPATAATAATAARGIALGGPISATVSSAAMVPGMGATPGAPMVGTGGARSAARPGGRPVGMGPSLDAPPLELAPGSAPRGVAVGAGRGAAVAALAAAGGLAADTDPDDVMPSSGGGRGRTIAIALGVLVAVAAVGIAVGMTLLPNSSGGGRPAATNPGGAPSSGAGSGELTTRTPSDGATTTPPADDLDAPFPAKDAGPSLVLPPAPPKPPPSPKGAGRGAARTDDAPPRRSVAGSDGGGSTGTSGDGTASAAAGGASREQEAPKEPPPAPEPETPPPPPKRTEKPQGTDPAIDRINFAGDAVQRGNTEFTQGNLAAAAQAYNRAIKLDPKNPYAHCGLGAVLAKRNQARESLREYRRCLNLLPDDDPWRPQVERLLDQAEDSDSAPRRR